MALITYLQWFEQEHPQFKIKDEEKRLQDTSTPSSDTTKLQQPPRMLVKLGVDHWEQIAQTCLENAKKNSSLNSQLGGLDKNAALGTEADVVRLAAEHLTGPLMSTLNAIYPKALIEFSEQGLQGLRADYAIKTTDSAEFTVILVEYKRCGYIREHEFEMASCDEKDLDSALQDLADSKKPCSLTKNSNAWCFVKQATSYHRRSKCKYIALCDYEHLILIRFRGHMDLKAAEVTIVPRSKFRKALLGFAIEGYENRAR
ncbi:hypothetical protein BDU57DRAFT_513988 [Ampelomyces quisqualis]|uniref:Uncharacterized protein n=1 Tax=Ampelomyces quisqualis TaxID=50730 RepID=A0A6A5QPN7_AMPQU|nr:hypothetical protein BDU57DRAFT_513988 [Ampelomyces quisqualis]